MPDYWIKITEREDEDLRHHHYLIAAKDEREARKLALKFMERFIDDEVRVREAQALGLDRGDLLVQIAQVRPVVEELKLVVQ